MFIRRGDGSIEPNKACKRLMADGLPGRSTRTASEWIVGLGFVLHPQAYPEYGLGRYPTVKQFAEAIAEWLARHNNGLSKDWAKSVRRHGSVEAAKASWVRTYLRFTGNTGHHFINRLVRAANALDPARCTTVQPSRAEVDRIFEIGPRAKLTGARLYRFEVWALHLLYTTRWVMRRSTAAGWEYRVKQDKDGNAAIQVEIASRWMEEWPYGKGELEGKTSYVAYLEILQKEGLYAWAAPYNRSREAHSLAGKSRVPGKPWRRDQATRYRIPPPEASLVRDLPVAPKVLKRAIEGIPGAHNRRLELPEAYHALHAEEMGLDLEARYGRRTRERIEALLQAIRSGLAAGQEVDVVEPAADRLDRAA